jgi:transposase InsO family protein
MKQFMTAQEIADAALPDLPARKSPIIRRAKREGWTSRARAGQGGGREYAVADLPLRALAELTFRDVEAAAAKVDRDDAPLDPYGDKKSAARASIIVMFNEFLDGSGLSITKASEIFVKRYNAQTLCVRPWIRRSVKTISARSLRRWKLKSDKAGLEGLKDAQRGPKGQNRFETDANLQAYIVAQIAGRPHVAATHIYAGVRANFENPPSLRSLQLYVKKYRKENASALLYAADPDKWKSHRRAAFGSLSEDVVRLNQKWEIDGTIADVKCIGPDGRPTRYSLVALVDVFSRRARVLVCDQPSAIATAACLRGAILDWGMPEVLKADNGKDYTAESVRRMSLELGFSINYCTPFSPEQKPHVERFFGTLTRELFEILPDYVGHSVADQQAMRARKSMAQRHGAKKQIAARSAEFSLAPGELQIVINDWIRDVYEARVHSAIKTSPMQKAAGQRTRRIEDERALDVLLAPPVNGGVRSVQKKGVSVYNRWFIAPELAGLVGEYVSVRLDVEDESRVIIYSADNGEFVCLAEDPTMSGADRQEIAKRARHVQLSKLKALKLQQKAATAAHNPEKLGSDILGHAAQENSKVKPIRAPYVEVSSPSLERAKEAADYLDKGRPVPPPLSTHEEEEAAAQIREMEAATAARSKMELTIHNPDRTVRPKFAIGIQGDIDFWVWAKGLKDDGYSLKPDDAAELLEMENNHNMQLLLLSHGVVTKDELRKKGMYK